MKLNPTAEMSNAFEGTSAKGNHVSLTDHEISSALIEIYRRISPLYGLYARIRLILAPLIETAMYVPPEGDILDLGCGNGMFAHLVRLQYPRRKILGIDKDESRIKTAQRTSTDPDLRFMLGDVEKVDWESTSVVTIVDLLHHMPFDAQKNLLYQVSLKLNKGFVLIKDLQKKPAWKYWFHYIQDSLSYRSQLYFRSSEEMVVILETVGFRVRIVDLAHGRPHPHVLYLCTKTS
jgi:2-polyprenyl-3-methyl-5-hydroxy-6-metoxy-1,4-benzoquinol methylase